MSDQRPWLRWARNQIHLSPAEFRVVVIVLTLFLFGALFYVWPNVRMVKLSYEFQAQQRLHTQLLREHTLLKLERDSLLSLDRVQYLAEHRLGMQHPQPEQIVTIFVK
ncbi:cell division protein FtsL [Nitrospina watsonii]|uniref:Cell division protein FtsL n=1 Tax=Nitrospina watsonii TaxID=1323948 RepID=A0ABM9HC95_9BACT|nr:cell division protein FtsL [Nitrospina watsonii]CAI2717702.1 conserved protein of unknown function [Nitrospina watsonii]